MTDWDQRQLCEDGACTGILGSDGTCSVCGKRGRPADTVSSAADSGSAKRGEETDFDEDDEYYYEDEDSDDEDGDEEDDDDEGDADADEDGVASVRAVGGEWTKRSLCPDGGCVGLIGDNGQCKVCGKSGGPG